MALEFLWRGILVVNDQLDLLAKFLISPIFAQIGKRENLIIIPRFRGD